MMIARLIVELQVMSILIVEWDECRIIIGDCQLFCNLFLNAAGSLAAAKAVQDISQDPDKGIFKETRAGSEV
jgi:hypothetical protein